MEENLYKKQEPNLTLSLNIEGINPLIPMPPQIAFVRPEFKQNILSTLDSNVMNKEL